MAELFEFVSFPERKTFSRKQLARCLGKFGYFYHLLASSAKGTLSRENLRERTTLVDDVESVCYLDLSDVKPLLEEAYREYVVKGDAEKARLKVLRALGRVRDSLAIFGEYC
ncbi:MAG TPA: hypothetical protein ENG66_05110 [Thermococcus sp.]|nr:MAG: hypothetical protein DRP04_06300 [Archaeoglobales archaeon]HDH44752.1 hypothetical protein [Thermococcus sp.]